jgi:hypothetical protein
MGALTNSGRKTANFAGFYKGIQSAGAAIVWRMDSLGKSYMTEFLSNWILLACALAFVFPVIWFKINDHIAEEDELEYDGSNIDGHDTADNATEGDRVLGEKGAEGAATATYVDKTQVEEAVHPVKDAPCPRLQPRDEPRPSRYPAYAPRRPPPSSTELHTPIPNVEGDAEPGLRTRAVPEMTLAEAVAVLEAEAPEVLEEFYRRSIQASGVHRQNIPGDI